MNILTKENLREIVPAAFATSPASTVSHRYSFINSERIVDECMSRGWMPMNARQSRRVADTQHATHMIEFRRTSNPVMVGDVFPQLTLINNHMALHRARIVAGFFRLWCSNGAMTSTGHNTKRDKIHIDDAALEFELAFQEALAGVTTAASQVERWTNIPLNFVQEQDFAKRAVLMKEHDVPFWAGEVDHTVFLERRREQDQKHDLWTVFNVVQENMLQGGVRPRSRLTQGITNVTEIERINVGLWNVATEFASSLN